MTSDDQKNGNSEPTKKARLRKRPPATDALNAPMIGRVPATPDTPAPTLADPGGDAATAYGEALERLQAVTTGQILLVTSEGRGASSGMVALNLAVSAAGVGLRTVLIDADLTGAGPTQFLRTGDGPGLIDLAAGEVDLKEASRLIAVDGTTRLPVVPRGRSGPEPEPQSAALADAVDQLSEHSDLVLVNMPADVTGGWRSALGAHADGSVLVVTGKESRADLGAAAAILTDVGAPVVGFVDGGEASGRRFRR
jgi:Mrp family chromosome partitioning ATPase